MIFGDAFMRNYFVAYNKSGNTIGFSLLSLIIFLNFVDIKIKIKLINNF